MNVSVAAPLPNSCPTPPRPDEPEVIRLPPNTVPLPERPGLIA